MKLQIRHVQKEVLMKFLLWQRYIDWNHTGLNTMNNYQVILTLYMQLKGVIPITRDIEQKRDS